MKRMIIAVCLAGLPFAGMADVTVNAFAKNGALAYLYDTDGNVTAPAAFYNGKAIIPTGQLVGHKDYGLAISYDPVENWWYSDIAWVTSGGANVPYKNLHSGSVYTVDAALTGAVTSHSLSGTTATATLSAQGPTGKYDNDDNALDAQLGLYRPALSQADMDDGDLKTCRWDGDILGSEYGWETNSILSGLTLITLTNTAGTFAAEYLGEHLNDDVYDIYLLRMDSGEAYADGSIVSNGNDVVFTVDGLGSGSYDDGVPYYVLMDAAWMYDEDGNYSETKEHCAIMTSPDHYIIPEPAVLSLLLAVSGGMLVARRFFTI